MGILYGMVATGNGVLAEFSATQTNGNAIAKQVIDKLPQGIRDSNLSYSHDHCIFHVNRTDNLTVLCMADDSSGRRIPFAFLEDIHQRFVEPYGLSIHSSAAYAMNYEFSRILSKQMDHYSNDPNADRPNSLEVEMSHECYGIDNNEKIVERGDRLNLLVDKTATLRRNTIRFKRTGTEIQKFSMLGKLRACGWSGMCNLDNHLCCACVLLP